MPRGRCWVEFDEKGPIRIFRNWRGVLAVGNYKDVREYPRKNAVAAIRQRVYELSGGFCKDCGGIITVNFHMHEEISRGKGGEISIENSIALCSRCHLEFEHGNRRLRFGE